MGVEEKIKKLPPELHKEVENYVDFLLQRTEKKTGTGKKLKLDWAGGLREYKDTYTSLELQRKILEWWGD
jgi:mRNA-degrading endonuclease RelE of RelBE toxin-antitoxin system